MALVDRAIIERDLAQTEGHISQGEHHIARQYEIIAELEQHDHDSTLAREFLDQLHKTQALHIEHRDRLRRELDTL